MSVRSSMLCAFCASIVLTVFPGASVAGGGGGGVDRVEFRSIDGTGNHVVDPGAGSANTALVRRIASAYADGVSSKAGPDRPGPREISNAVAAQNASVPNSARASDWVWQWGQFLDHDLDLTEGGGEICNISTPATDPFFLGAPIPFERSIFDPATSVPGTPREQINQITAFIDASNVYGSDLARAAFLRSDSAPMLLKMSAGRMPPFNTGGFPNASQPGQNPEELFLAGDVRANEQIGLTAIHTIFAREHNRLARIIERRRPDLDQDQVYEWARLVVGAEMQVITYEEFLPVLLGANALDPYRRFDDDVNPGIANIFSTGCYRLGHSMLSSTIRRVGADGNTIPEGDLPLQNAFFNPAELMRTGVEPILRGLAGQVMQEVDTRVVSDVRNFLFGPPGAGGFDLASLNIQRGRDHGLPDYNSARRLLGLTPVSRFSDISSDPNVQGALASVYSTVDQIDLWVGGLAEDHVNGGIVGELIFTVLKDQFERLRDGDRFWHENLDFLNQGARDYIRRQTLAKVIIRNSDVRATEIQENVFLVP